MPAYQGCFSEGLLSEAFFKQANAYYISNSAMPTQFHKSSALAQAHGARYFALAHVNPTSGFGWIFNTSLPGKADQQGGGCDTPCTDDKSDKCGCGDDGYTAGCPQTSKSDTTTRRWAVYAFGR